MTKQPEPISVDGPVSAKETAEVAAASSGFFSRHPSQIGPYKILQRIGEGGFGRLCPERRASTCGCEVIGGYNSTRVLNPPKNMRLPSNGIVFGFIMGLRRGSLITFALMRSRCVRDL